MFLCFQHQPYSHFFLHSQSNLMEFHDLSLRGITSQCRSPFCLVLLSTWHTFTTIYWSYSIAYIRFKFLFKYVPLCILHVYLIRQSLTSIPLSVISKLGSYPWLFCSLPFSLLTTIVTKIMFFTPPESSSCIFLNILYSFLQPHRLNLGF